MARVRKKVAAGYRPSTGPEQSPSCGPGETQDNGKHREDNGALTRTEDAFPLAAGEDAHGLSGVPRSGPDITPPLKRRGI